MKKIHEVYLKAVLTAQEMSATCIELLNQKEFNSALNVLDNRSRVVNIIMHLDEQIRLEQDEETNEARESLNNQVSQLLSDIDAKDAVIAELLNKEKILTQNEIAKTSKNKENFKGYNLNNLK